jgi:hypothetical protein
MLFAPPPGYNSPFINRQNPQAFNVPGQQGLSPQGYNASTFGTAALGAPQPSWRPQGNTMPMGMMSSPMSQLAQGNTMPMGMMSSPMSQLGRAHPSIVGGAMTPSLPPPMPMAPPPMPAPTSGTAPPPVTGGAMTPPPNPASFAPQASAAPPPQAPILTGQGSFGSIQPTPSPASMARALNPAGFGSY